MSKTGDHSCLLSTYIPPGETDDQIITQINIKLHDNGELIRGIGVVVSGEVGEGLPQKVTEV